MIGFEPRISGVGSDCFTTEPQPLPHVLYIYLRIWSSVSKLEKYWIDFQFCLKVKLSECTIVRKGP